MSMKSMTVIGEMESYAELYLKKEYGLETSVTICDVDSVFGIALMGLKIDGLIGYGEFDLTGNLMTAINYCIDNY